MPIYEYRCKDCGEEIEVMQSVSSKPLKRCEKCGGNLEKLISQNAFHLKGAGWFKTDYAPTDKTGDKKSSSGKGKEETKKEAKSSTEVKEEKKKTADTKSAA